MSVVSSVLLRRLRTVYVDQAGPRPGDPSTAEGLTALEAELLDRGFAPTAELRAALAWLGPAGLADAGRGLLSRLDAELGADRPHMPLFRSFATDVLRLLAVRSGGEADLLEPRRFLSVPRPLRRRLLSVLEGLDTTSLVEDLLRHPGLWKKAAEVLHPYERHARYPRVAMAFAVLRGTSLDTGNDPLGEALRRTAAEHPRVVRVDGLRLKPHTWSGRVETALAGREPDAALALLSQRPGELVRRLDHLLRLYGSDTLDERVAGALRRALPGAGPGPLLSALGRLRIRHLPGDRRVFFPRGRVTHAWTTDDRRAPLPHTLSAEVCRLLENEVLRRLGTAPRFDVAVLDAALSGLAVPSAEGAAAKALVAVPRGSNQPLPRGEVLRMFLHWTQPAGTRVDLDLSVALFDADWTYVGLCDFTRLVHGRRSVVHSGDLTSAPAPRGATEYADMDLAALSDEGVRFAMPIVLSYNNVPFEQLLDAFAGFMALPSREGRDAAYDPRTVRQRYDLVGDSQVHVPMLVDLEHRTFLWTDLHLPASDGFQSVGSHSAELARVGKDLHQYFTAGRTTLWDLAVWHAAGRTDAVHVLRRGHGGPDEVWGYERRPAEPVEAFADRIRRSGAPDRRSAGADGPRTAGAVADGRRAFLALLDGDVVPDGASGTVYRLLPGPVDGCGLEQAAAGDLVALLG